MHMQQLFVMCIMPATAYLQVTLLGKEYVIWWDESVAQWSVLEDRCPHRLAQLSLGRIVDGQLMCSYHGWRFDGNGSCVSIPQVVLSAVVFAGCSVLQKLLHE